LSALADVEARHQADVKVQLLAGHVNPRRKPAAFAQA
jgi:hypothetical protein